MVFSFSKKQEVTGRLPEIVDTVDSLFQLVKRNSEVRKAIARHYNQTHAEGVEKIIDDYLQSKNILQNDLMGLNVTLSEEAFVSRYPEGDWIDQVAQRLREEVKQSDSDTA